MVSICNPIIDGTWKNFQTNYGAVGDGVTNDSPSLDLWLADTGATKLWIPPTAAFYHFAGTGTLTTGKTVAQVSGWSLDFLSKATIDLSYIGAVAPIPEDQSHSARSQTILAGATSAMLLDIGDASKFTIGKWILICGLAIQNFGWPPNWQYNEYRQVTGISGAVISWSEPLQFVYKSTWPDLNPGIGFGDLAGPATLYALADSFDTDSSVTGFIFSQAAQLSIAGRNIFVCGCECSGQGFSPGQTKSSIIRNSQIGSSSEVDKAAEYIEYDNCTGITDKKIDVQSSSITNLVINNTTITTLNGTAQNTTIKGSTITDLVVGPLSYGHGVTLNATNSIITGTRIPLHNVPVGLGTFFQGTFSIAVGVVDSNKYNETFVPGQKYFFAYYDGTIHNVDDDGHITTFTVTDIRVSGGVMYVDISLVSLPSPTFGGQLANFYVAYAIDQAYQSNIGSADITQYVAPSVSIPNTWRISS